MVSISVACEIAQRVEINFRKSQIEKWFQINSIVKVE